MGKYFNKDKDLSTNAQAVELVVHDGVLMKYNGNSKSVEIPGNVRRICSEAFSGCDVVAELNIPDCVKEIVEEEIDTSSDVDAVEVVNEENDMADKDGDQTVVVETVDDEYKNNVEQKDVISEDVDVVLHPVIAEPIVESEGVANDDAEPERENDGDADAADADELDVPIVEGVEVKDGQIYYIGTPIFDASIAVLNLSTRPYNCLYRAQRKDISGGRIDVKVSDLLAYTRRDLMQVRNLGKKSAEEIVEKLQNYVLGRASSFG